MKFVKLSIKTLEKFKLYSAIYVLGLALSLACVILIARYVQQESTVNGFIHDLDRTYITTVEEKNGKSWFWGVVDKKDPEHEGLLKNPHVQAVTSFLSFEEDNINLNGGRITVKSLGIDSLFFKVLPYPIVSGKPNMLTPNDAIITERFARKVFGKENPIGKKFIHSSNDELTVVGVVGEPVTKSFLDFDLLLNRNQRTMMGIPYDLVVLQQNSSVEQLNKQYDKFTESRQFAGKNARFQLFPLKKFYFDTHREFPPNIYLGASEPIFIRGNKNAVNVLIIVSALILLIGLFNFINIYTVIILKRGKEFGVKKIFGAEKGQIFRQIYFENLFLTLIAMFLSLFFIEITETLLSVHLNFIVAQNIAFTVLLCTVTAVFLPLISSVFPFLKYCYSAPITSLRHIRFGRSGFISRWTFLFLQYTITLGLLIAAQFFMKQLNFMLHANHGYNTENVVVCRMMHRDFSALQSTNFEAAARKIDEDAALIKKKMDESPLFSNWEFGKPIHDLMAYVPFKRSDGSEYRKLKIVNMSPHFLKMFGFELKEGRLWDSTDMAAEYKFIINESAKKLFKITDIQSQTLQPERPLMRDKSNPPYKIVGVINDFQTGHLSKNTVPLAILFQERGNHFDYLMTRFIPERREEALDYLADIYKQVNGEAEFTYTLLQDDIAALYKDDRRISRVYTLFAVIAIFISCLGLFGLSLFDIRQRYREIALRKINGAKTKDIMPLLLKKYLILISISSVVAIPAVYLAIRKYLENFAHQTIISWWIFVIAVLIVLLISLLTLVWQVRNAVRINPAKILKSE